MFSHVGLKSKQSVKLNSPVGSGSSGSTLVAEYVGILSYSIWPAWSEYESTEKKEPVLCEK